MNSKTGKLYVVATPIGNLGDISPRAVEQLGVADLILAEDTRHASILLRHCKIETPMKSFHEHNESRQINALTERLVKGEIIALISDAGTPLISDPGYQLVRQARDLGIPVSPIPGPSALIAALSVSGQATDRFCFEGFLPARAEARKQRLQCVKSEVRTLVFYESSHRIAATLQAMLNEFGGERVITVAREITKKFESFYFGSLNDVVAMVADGGVNQKGEFVIVVSGAKEIRADYDRSREVLGLLMAEMPLKRASKLAARILGQSGNEMYALGLKLKE